ncbi:MAG: NAD+ synthase [Pseudomonadota bacterium]
MSDHFRITLAQLDAVVGDIDGNAEKIMAAWRTGREAGADLVVVPEMMICGYQCQDLITKPSFVAACAARIKELADEVQDGPALMVGGPEDSKDGVYNGVWLLNGGKVQTVFHKHMLPNDGVFDEKRLHQAGPAPGPASIGGVRIGVPICEDAWYPEPVESLEESGAEILIVPNGSPYERGKYERERIPLMISRVIESRLPLVYLNLVGAQDDQMFDGGSFVLNPGGGLAAQMAFFEEQTLHIDFDRTPEGWRCREVEKANLPDDWEADYRVMVETVRGYFAKSGFTQALLGLSGGVDSALTATIAADALGPDNVRCVMLPSRFTSDESLEDAAAVAKLLGCQLDTLPIGDGVDAIEASLAPLFGAAPRDITEENIQSRLRGLYLMALSNKTGALLLTTGNKSEVAVGYATLYGDMCGAFNPLKDLYKTRVFETCRWRNANHRPWMMAPSGEVMPSRVIDKPPTAELREDQKDEDSLPPYERLDVILEGLIERDLSVADLVEEGFDRAEVARVERLIYTSEYKRFQSAMGTKLTQKAFWLDRRYPITNRWRSG